MGVHSYYILVFLSMGPLDTKLKAAHAKHQFIKKYHSPLENFCRSSAENSGNGAPGESNHGAE